MAGIDILRIAVQACSRVGLGNPQLVLLGAHATSVYLSPVHRLVVRVSRDDLDSPTRAVAICRWLAAQEFPAVVPAEVEQPVVVDDHIITFWVHYPRGERSAPEPGDLAPLLRRLHDLPPPPVELPPYRPLESLLATVTSSTSLSAADRDWLLAERERLLAEYAQLDFPLGFGHIHGDAYPGNVIWDGPRPRLGDWDETGTGPREVDLVNTYQGARFGQPAYQLDEFAAAYGYDITSWDGLATMRSMRDIHTLGAYIRRADGGDRAASIQLRFRLDSLRDHDVSAVWTSLAS